MTGLLLLTRHQPLGLQKVTPAGHWAGRGISELLFFPQVFFTCLNELHLWLVESGTKGREGRTKDGGLGHLASKLR